MAVSTTSTLKIELTWLQKDTGGGSSNSQDAVAMTQTMSLSTGASTGNSNNVWYSNGNLTGTQKYTIDLFNLSRELFGASLSGTFENGRIRFIGVENTSTGTGLNQIFYVVNTGTNDLKGYSNGSGCTLPVYPGGMLALSNHISGHIVNSSNRYLNIVDAGNGSSYEIGIVGTTG